MNICWILFIINVRIKITKWFWGGLNEREILIYKIYKFFLDLSTEEIDVFKDELNIMRYKKYILFKPGDKADTMYIIASGR